MNGLCDICGEPGPTEAWAHPFAWIDLCPRDLRLLIAALDAGANLDNVHCECYYKSGYVKISGNDSGWRCESCGLPYTGPDERHGLVRERMREVIGGAELTRGESK